MGSARQITRRICAISPELVHDETLERRAVTPEGDSGAGGKAENTWSNDAPRHAGRKPVGKAEALAPGGLGAGASAYPISGQYNRGLLIDKLRGGDRRSLGGSAGAVAAVGKTPALFGDLFECLFDDDPVVRMRAADAVEKVTRERPQLLQPWKRPLLETVAAREEKEVRWHVAQLLPRLKLTAAERETAVAILTGYLSDESSIVKTFSMQALAELAEQDESLLGQVAPIIERLSKTGTAAMRSRGRKLLERLRR